MVTVALLFGATYSSPVETLEQWVLKCSTVPLVSPKSFCLVGAERVSISRRCALLVHCVNFLILVYAPQAKVSSVRLAIFS